jgi:hypothetical protein
VLQRGQFGPQARHQLGLGVKDLLARRLGTDVQEAGMDGEGQVLRPRFWACEQT